MVIRCRRMSVGSLLSLTRGNVSGIVGLILPIVLVAVPSFGATVIWDGGGDGTTWGDPVNWSGNALPTALDSVVIDVPGTINVALTGLSVVLDDLQCEENLVLSGGSFEIRGTAVINGMLSMSNLPTITVRGAGASLQANGATSCVYTNLYAYEGGVLVMPQMNAYAVGNTNSSTWLADGGGSTLSLPGVTSLVGSLRQNYVRPETHAITAQNGGMIDLSGLAGMTRRVTVTSSGVGSSIDLSSMSSMDGTSSVSNEATVLNVINGGAIDASSLTTAVGASFTASNTLPGVLTDLTLPSLVSYMGDDAYNTNWRTSGESSTLLIPNLAELTGCRNTNGSYQHKIWTSAKGRILLPSLVTVKTRVYIQADGQDSLVDLPVLRESNGGTPNANWVVFEALNNAVINVPSLEAVAGTSFYVKNLSVSTPTVFTIPLLTAYSGQSNSTNFYSEGSGALLAFSNLTTLSGSTGNIHEIRAIGGGIIDLPVVNSMTNCVGIYASGQGSLVNVSALESMSAAGVGSASVLIVLDGGVLNTASLDTLVGVSLGAQNTVSGRTTTLDLPLVTSYTGIPYATSFQANGDSSLVRLGSLQTLVGCTQTDWVHAWFHEVHALNHGRVELPSLVSMTRRVKVFSAGPGSYVDLGGLTSMDASNVGTDDGMWLEVSDTGQIDVSALQQAGSVNLVAKNTSPGPVTTLSLPSLITYTCLLGLDTVIRAQGDGACLELPVLPQLVGQPSNGQITLESLDGGLLRLPVTTPIVRRAAINVQNATVELRHDATALQGVTVTLTTSGLVPAEIQTGTLSLDATSVLTGIGTISGSVLNAGSLRPGSPLGVVTIDGGYTQTSTGLMQIELGGVVAGIQYDQIDVSGATSLDGVLNVSTVDGFIPGQSEKFDVLFFGSKLGDFSAKNGLDLGGGHILRAVYRPNRLVLGELAGLISPAVPVISTPRNVSFEYDLSQHNEFAAQPSWSISPSDTTLYTAVIDSNEILTITPKTNEHGTAAPTLTLTDLSDGFSDVQDLDLTVELILPTPPIPFIFPTGNPMETDNLVCGLLPGTVGPGCFPQYRYTWTNTDSPTRPPEAPPFEAKTVVNGPKVDVVDILDASYTSPYESWTCSVDTYDGQYYSTEAGTATSGVIQPLAESTLSLDVAPQIIALGEAVALSGHIDPVVGVVAVAFDSTSGPVGGTNTKPPTINTTTTSTFSQVFYPDEAGSWAIAAGWQGDHTHFGDTASAPLTVAKASPDLSLSLSHTAALLELANAPDFTVAAGLSVPGWPTTPNFRALLTGRTIRLAIMTPSGETPYAPLEKATDANGNAVFAVADFAAAGVSFDQAGVWKFKAEFVGDVNLEPAVTEDFDYTSARLTIKQGAGYAILVTGKLDAFGEGHLEHGQTTEYVYQVLLERGFTDADIHYLREFLPGEPDAGYPVDGPPTAAALQDAIETWAAQKMQASPAPLYVILVDHGSPGIFHMDITGTGPMESIGAIDVDHSLDLLQSALGVSDQPIFVIDASCYSGSFIPVLSGPNRIVITSTSEGEISYRGVVNTATGARDGDFFLNEFFRNAAEGRTIRQSFELACGKTYEYTATRTGTGGTVPQHPLLDDNTDGIGTTGELSSIPGMDGAVVSYLDLGLGSNAGNGITWFTVEPPLTLDPGDTITGLWAETTGRALLPGDPAWIEVKTPGYTDGTVATPGYEQFQRVALMVGPVSPGTPPQPLGGGKYRFTWTQSDLEAQPGFAGFNTSGTYKVYYFLRDGLTGQAGAYLVTNIYVSQLGNEPPEAVELLYPSPDGIVHPNLYLAWTESTDPNADAVTYRVELSEDQSFPAGSTIVIDGLTDTLVQLGPENGIVNEHDYYWRVIPVDPYGASPTDNEVRLLLVRGFPGVLGGIRGKVTSVGVGTPIQGAEITVTPSSKTGSSSSTGLYFVGDLPQSTYTVEVTAPGYQTTQMTDVEVASGDITTVNIAMPSDGSNHAPVLTPVGHKTVAAGELLTLTLSAFDSDGDPLTYTATNVPAGASFSPTTRTFTWIPSVLDLGPHSVTFGVADNRVPPRSDSETVTITVVSGITISGPSSVEEGKRAELRVHIPSATQDWVYEWRKDGVLLPAVTGSTLVIESATFDDAGTYEVTAWDPNLLPITPISAQFVLDVTAPMPVSANTMLLSLVGVLVAAGLVRIRYIRRKTARHF